MTVEKREFQAETKQLLELMIHSIYTNRDIFLRELISNASDAIDKLRFEALTNPELLGENNDLEIMLLPDETSGTLTIADNGMGMTHDEVIENIGTIAKSGTKAFLAAMQEKENAGGDTNLIGQFGVGFYSAFMVADKVTLLTRAPGQEKGVRWESTGDGTYTLEECEKESRGTTIILSLKEEHRKAETESEQFLNKHTLERLVKKYSDYIRFPIRMSMPVMAPPAAEGEEPQETKEEVRVLNSMSPLWMRNKNEIKPEEYNQLYKHLFLDWQDPMEVIHSKVEGAVEYTSVLFIPSHAPFDFYQREVTTGIRLYSKNVFIMDDCQDLLPEYLRFAKGLVDSPDVSLNISREVLQQSLPLKKIGKNLEKSLLKTLEQLCKKDRPKYETFWKEYGKALKSGVYSDFSNRERLQDLLLFSTSRSEDELTTLADYVERMPEKQSVIYYAAGKDRTAVERLPQMEMLQEKGLEVLYLFDRVDEFAVDALGSYKEKQFRSISRGELQLDDLEDETDKKKEQEELTKENSTLLEAIKKHLEGKVTEVKLSHRLTSSPVCLVSDAQGISLSMEQILADMDQKNSFKASRILELNPNHAVFKALQAQFTGGNTTSLFGDYCELLYGQALLLEGLAPEDPGRFAQLVASLMAAPSAKA